MIFLSKLRKKPFGVLNSDGIGQNEEDILQSLDEISTELLKLFLTLLGSWNSDFIKMFNGTFRSRYCPSYL